MSRAFRIGVVGGSAFYALRLVIAFISLVRAQPRFGGTSGYPLSAIWIEAVRLLPWFGIAAIVIAILVHMLSVRRIA